jgi:hypothetical protein
MVTAVKCINAMGFAIVVALACTLGSCTLFLDELPDRTCETNRDCFVAQGEICNLTSKLCEMAPAAQSVKSAMEPVEVDLADYSLLGEFLELQACAP